MNAPDNMYLPDVQSAADARNIAIQRVGVKSLTHPLLVATSRGPQPSVASVDMTVALPAEQKGTHMSRFIDVLQSHRDALSYASLHALLERMLQRLDAHDGAITLRLPYFVLKTAPVSGVESLMDYQLTLAIERTGQHDALSAEGRGAGHQPVPVQQEGRGLRRPQPARAHHADPRPRRADAASRSRSAWPRRPPRARSGAC